MCPGTRKDSIFVLAVCSSAKRAQVEELSFPLSQFLWHPLLIRRTQVLVWRECLGHWEVLARTRRFGSKLEPTRSTIDFCQKSTRLSPRPSAPAVSHDLPATCWDSVESCSQALRNVLRKCLWQVCPCDCILAVSAGRLLRFACPFGCCSGPQTLLPPEER